MIYLGNGLYSDSGHSLMHYGVKNMRWDPSKRKTNVDWSDPEEVAAYYNRTAVQDGSHAPRGGFVTPRSPRDVKNRADTKKQPNGGFVTPRPNYTSGRAKADEEKSPRGGFVTPRSSAERRAADDRARSPRGGFTAPRPGYVTRDQDDKKRSPKGGPHFATKEYQQKQLNARLHKDSRKAFSNAYNDQLKRQQGTLYEAVAGGGLSRRNGGAFDDKSAKDAARRTTKSAQAGVEAGRKRVEAKKKEQERQQRAYENGLKAGRERARKSSQKNRGYQTSLTQKDSGVKNYDAGLEAARKRALDKKKKKTKGEQRSKAKDWYFNNWVKKHLQGG